MTPIQHLNSLFRKFFYFIFTSIISINNSNDIGVRDNCLHKYFRGAHYTKAFGSIAEATAEATDHLWEIAPLNRAIPEFLKPGKIYFANKLPLNTQGE